MEMVSSSKLRAIILGSPGMGHVIPVLQLANRLILNHGFEITLLLVSSTESPPLMSHLLPSPEAFSIVTLPPIDISGFIDSNATLVTQIAVLMRHARSSIRLALSTMDRERTVFIVDLFGTESLEFADEFGMPKYVFIPTTAWFLSLMTYCQVLDKEVEGDFADRVEPLRIPGCRPVRPEDVMHPLLDRSDQQYRECVRIGMQYGGLPDGILLNTWQDLERGTLQALRENERLASVVKAPVYPVGPLIRGVSDVEKSGWRDDNKLLTWLDRQPRLSVLYVSFGSGGTMTAEQITELAWGLELSGRRFIWVVRPPLDSGPLDSKYISGGSGQPDDAATGFLPHGFITRTRDVGLVVTHWAPQVEILSHPSIGGFMSHCGWNSTLEALTKSLPMIAWPLFAEQTMNATFLAEEAGVAVQPKKLMVNISRVRVVERKEIKIMVERVMEEDSPMRKRAREIQESAMKAIEAGGSSDIALNHFTQDCIIRLNLPANGSIMLSSSTST